QILAQELIRAGHEVFVVTLPALKEYQQREFADGQVKVICSKRPGNIHWYIQKIPLLDQLSLGIRELERSYALWMTFRKIQKIHSFDIIEFAETGGLLITLLRRKTAKTVVKLHGESFTYNAHTPNGDVGLRVRLERFVQVITL